MFRARISARSALLTAEEYKAEVLARCPSAVYWHIDITKPTPEDEKFHKFLKLVDLNRAYIDLSSATDEERIEYEEHCSNSGRRAPDEIWHFILRSNDDKYVKGPRAEYIQELTVSEAQSVCLSYSRTSEEDVWRQAWSALKSEQYVFWQICFVLALVGLVMLGLALWAKLLKN